MKEMKVAWIVAALVMMTVASLWLHRVSQIDTCLDNGGRWRSQMDLCEGGEGSVPK
jgi:hypothetical protein